MENYCEGIALGNVNNYRQKSFLAIANFVVNSCLHFARNFIFNRK